MILGFEESEYIQNLIKEQKRWYKYFMKYEFAKDLPSDQEETKTISNTKDEIKENAEEYKIKNSHDKAIRTILSNPEEAAILINKVTSKIGGKPIEAEDIEEYKTNFVTLDYYDRESDIIFRDKKEKDVFYLIEHQSKVDFRMPLRIAEYYHEIIRKEAIYKNITSINSRFPIIISIVLYTEKGEWTAYKSIREGQHKVKGIEPQAIGSYYTFVTDECTDEELLNEKGSLFKIILLERAEDVNKIKADIERISNYKLENIEIENLNQYISVILRNEYGKDISDEILKKINKNKGGKGSMIIDVINKEIEKTRIETKRETVKQMIIEMLKNNFDESIIKKISGVSNKELQEIKDSMC